MSLLFKPGLDGRAFWGLGIGIHLRTFPDNRMAPNPGGVAKGTSFDKVMGMDLGVGCNAEARPDVRVHGFFPTKEGARTALGGVLNR